MKEYNEINKAIDKIDGWYKTVEDFQKAIPYLNENLAYLKWQQQVYNEMPEKKDELISYIDGPIQDILAMDLNNFSMSFATGSTATILTGSTETIKSIQLAGSDFQHLINEYDNINPIEKLIDSILIILKLIDIPMSNQFEEVKNSYSQWKANLRDNSDLAKDIRTFQEEFQGIINKLRVPKSDWGKVDIPKMSWNKMVEAISKKGSQNTKAFMKQQKIGIDIWEELTPILKKDKLLLNSKMDSLFKRYLEHVYSILNLIDENLINQK